MGDERRIDTECQARLMGQDRKGNAGPMGGLISIVLEVCCQDHDVGVDVDVMEREATVVILSWLVGYQSCVHVLLLPGRTLQCQRNC